MRYRVAFCTTELRAGGAERCLVELATRLDRHRFDCSVVSLAQPPADMDRSLAPRLEAAGVPVHYLGVRRTTDAWRAVSDLAKHLRLQPPNLVQTFLFHANLIGRIAAARAGVPCIVSGIRVAEHRARYRLWLDRWTARMVVRHVCVSESVAVFSRDVGGLPADRLMVIPNGVDVEAYKNLQPAALESVGVAGGRRFVACIGRLDPQKGQRWLIEHARGWLDQLPDHDLVLVGDGPDAAILEAQITAEGLRDRVHLPGWRQDVGALLTAADLLVLPSAWEGMPNVVLEAMAAGRAIVARDVEGVRELLGAPGESPQVVLRNSPQLFSQQIVAILNDGDLRSRLQAQNYALVRAEFSLEAMIRRYEQLYLELLGPQNCEA